MNYIVYKTTNIINSKIYIGIHQQKEDPDIFDGYLGSGKILRKSIEKYGESNFIRETLFSFEDLLSSREKEKELVNEEFVKRKDTYNTSIGGTGGNTIAGYSEDERNSYKQKLSTERKTRNVLRREFFANGTPFSDETIEKIKISAKQRVKEHPNSIPENKNRKHSKESLENFKIAGIERRGKYVKITDGCETKTIKITDTIPEGWYRGVGEDWNVLKEHTQESKEKIGNHPSLKGIKKYTNGKENVNLKPGQEIPEGYYPGISCNRIPSIWINDGVSSKLSQKGLPIPEGWSVGRIMKNRVK